MSKLYRVSLASSIILSLLVLPRQAVAGSSCSSSGGGSSSSGGGSSSSGGGGSSSSGGGSSSSGGGAVFTSTPACSQTTKTVGRAECRTFGEGWDRSRQPRIRVGLGVTHTSLSLGQVDLSGTASHDEVRHDYHYQPTTPDDALGAQLIGGTFGMSFLIRDAHLGFDMGIGGGSIHADPHVNDQGLRVRPTLALQIQAKVVGGYATRFGKWGLLGELQAGMSTTLVEVETKHADCVATSVASRVAPVLEPRFVLQRWLSPWLTADLGVGSDLFQERDIQVGLSLTAHSRSYDGMR